MENQITLRKKRRFNQYLDEDNVSNLPGNSHTASALARSKIPKSTSLCSRCATINFAEIFDRRIHFYGGDFILDLGASIEQLKSSSCSLCQLFASMAPKDFDEKNGEPRVMGYHLLAINADSLFGYLGQREPFISQGVTLLGVVRYDISKTNFRSATSELRISCVETGLLSSVKRHCSPPKFGVRPLSAEAFDVEFARDQIQCCQRNHNEVCSIKSSHSFYRVIDCRTKAVRPAPPECEYVALSYVWGVPTADQLPTCTMDSGQPHLALAPKVITDAIDVTLALGFRYLWVDRYCINQLDGNEKHDQIRKMDTIYANSQVTIIAAAGDGPDHGLPGVNGTLRRIQPNLNLGDHTLLSTLPHPMRAIQRSKWATRGWTYQEGLLSKRCIIFTEYQVFFECNGMHTVESRVQPLDAIHDKRTQRFELNVPLGDFDWEAAKYISEFTKRDLTYPEDALNAMQGIFRVFEGAEKPVYQLVGVPIITPSYAGQAKQHSPAQNFLVGLTWYTSRPGRRREHFPSWSWAGWTGTMSSALMFHTHLPSEPTPYSKVFIEKEDGTSYDFPDDVKELPVFLSHLRNDRMFIYIQTKTLKCQIKNVATEQLQKRADFPSNWIRRDFCAQVSHCGRTFYADMYLDSRADSGEITGEQYTAVVLSAPPGFLVALIVKEKDAYAERVGCCAFSDRRTRSFESDASFGTWDIRWGAVTQKIRLG